MRSSNFGYVLLLGVVFTAPACKVETHITGGEAGSGGNAGTGGSAGKSGSAGTNASAGQGGSGGSSGAAETGGASGASGGTDTGGAAGSSEGGGAGEPGAEAGAGGACDTSGFEFPEVTCDTGAVSELTNPTCQDVFLCLGLADCAASHMDCALCLDYLKVAFKNTDTCIQSATQTTLANACTRLAEDSASQYPECAPK